ncbi:long-chain-fatty-acid--CoA ligase [gamma proteobacterium BDW918]|jgi:long-chain acyl-CoA synthetase|uniref:Long-chain-fatty-acid--CoA ligase n=1 Tax=Zhongshania aliphaticivorans TaxID=1470434 RepID=A0A127M4M5_9GAMM|nr:AMP-binding protein [Zhongshania aliphaticivorans]AMO68177.1 long-chain fatty acid--CoA ligase [Zhongshania aliphaticivorans]EIF44288.1 long-chain-fatty-acid--CoA ligase [gamma proteobacterium BDW918]
MESIAAVIKAARAKVGMPDDVDLTQHANLGAMFNYCVSKFGDLPAMSCMGETITYNELDKLSAQFATYLQKNTNLRVGDRIALQMPNILQYPVALFGAIRAGLIVVNTNPLYSQRELKHQLNDSGAKALVVLANVAEAAAAVVDETPVEFVIVTEIGDLHPTVKRLLINNVVKHVKKMVPKFKFKNAIKYRSVLAKGKSGQFTQANPGAEEVALLQYTGGTTGVSKGAMISHRNLMANILQSKNLFESFGLKEGEETFLSPLPLYHIYSFMLSFCVMLQGNHGVLIANPRDLSSVIKEMKRYRWSGMSGINTLFVQLCNNDEFRALDFSSVKATMSGGMALTAGAAKEWMEVTGAEVYEGYGLTETSPVVSINPGGNNQIGTIGVALPGTDIRIVVEGVDKGVGERGELCVRGPQVMMGYWQRPDETEKTIIDGWLHTGDVAVVQEDGYMRIVDRMKDMIIVSGFNVYPNEIEDVLSGHPNIAECAAIGVPDEKSGEAVKIFVAAKKGDIDVTELKAFLRERLTGYKMPRYIEVRDELPKTNVGKVLRRSLRDEELAKLAKANK